MRTRRVNERSGYVFGRKDQQHQSGSTHASIKSLIATRCLGPCSNAYVSVARSPGPILVFATHQASCHLRCCIFVHDIVLYSRIDEARHVYISSLYRVSYQSAGTVPCCIHLVLPLTRSTKQGLPMKVHSSNKPKIYEPTCLILS